MLYKVGSNHFLQFFYAQYIIWLSISLLTLFQLCFEKCCPRDQYDDEDPADPLAVPVPLNWAQKLSKASFYLYLFVQACSVYFQIQGTIWSYDFVGRACTDGYADFNGADNVMHEA